MKMKKYIVKIQKYDVSQSPAYSVKELEINAANKTHAKQKVNDIVKRFNQGLAVYTMLAIEEVKEG